MYSYKTGGLKDKYIILKKDGTPIDEGAYYFPLRLDAGADPFAAMAAMAYAIGVRDFNRQLSDEVMDKLYELRGMK